MYGAIIGFYSGYYFSRLMFDRDDHIFIATIAIATVGALVY